MNENISQKRGLYIGLTRNQHRRTKKNTLKYFLKSSFFHSRYCVHRFSPQWVFLKCIKWLFALILFIISFSIWGCASATGQTKIEYQRVEVPIKMQCVVWPKKPTGDGDPITLNFEILEYSKSLEAALKNCE